MCLAPLPLLLLGVGSARADDASTRHTLDDVQWMVGLGPRPARGEAELAALLGVRDRLIDAGWTPTTVGCPGCLVACRTPDGAPDASAKRLFLAHVDSVERSPGAVDNAAGVAALLELARTTTTQDLCLGFPPAEEVGLVGSAAMARAWPEPLPELVVALDLTGHGRLSVTGLGPAWSGDALGWLFDTADLDSPYAYRVVSRALPGMERSDHRPFADRGVRAMHLLGRGEGGVFPRYHQPEDTEVQAQAMSDLGVALQALATAPLPGRGAPDAAAVAGRFVLPAPLVWLLLLAGGLSGLNDLLRPCEGAPVLGALKGLGGLLVRGLVGVAIGAALLAAPTLFFLLAPSPAELTAHDIMGVQPSGWWAGAAVGVLLGGVGFLGVRRWLGGRGSAPLAAALLGALTLPIDPLLALPFAVAALLARLHPVLGALPALYLLWPDKLRELAFHGLLPPSFWGVLFLLAVPAFGAQRLGAQRLGAQRLGAQRLGAQGRPAQ